jgi:hypothetical protein
LITSTARPVSRSSLPTSSGQLAPLGVAQPSVFESPIATILTTSLFFPAISGPRKPWELKTW